MVNRATRMITVRECIGEVLSVTAFQANAVILPLQSDHDRAHDLLMAHISDQDQE